MIGTIGLIFNFIGTLLIILFIGKDQNEWTEKEGKYKNKKYYALFINCHRCLNFGIILIVIGFIFSLIDSLLK
ncbi:MAG: hypothetical protein PHE59_01400 [Patescibacteria group bacterium]|nr:hypothetical protein [Patescibacteria group bacterium]